VSLLDHLLGKPLSSAEQEEQKIGVLAGVPVLGLDGLSSAAYGPEAALAVLLPLGAAGLLYIGPIMLVILGLLAILYLSYRQTIAAYPGGGGSYTVAKENLGTGAGLLAAAALMADYILNVAVGISAGIGALVSAVPSLHSHILALCLIALALITLVNLRGAKDSGAVFGLPTYVFVGTLAIVLVVGVVKAIASGGRPAPIVHPPAIPRATQLVGIWLLMRAFASGCTAMTGVEAVSNGVTAFRKPGVQNAQWTLTWIVAILMLLLGGIAYLARAYGITAMDQSRPEYQSVISQLVSAVMGRGPFYYVTIAAVLAVLVLSANTSFAGFPRLCRLIALDSYMPHAFTVVGRRLVFSTGILALAGLAGLLLIVFGGITDRLIPLFAVGAFGAFTLSQAGMVMHWKRSGKRHATLPLAVNAVGASCTAVALGVILAAKFMEGAWVTVLIVPCALLLFVRIKRHYDYVGTQIQYSKPIEITDNREPIVVLPVEAWNIVSERAVRFAVRISDEVYAVHIAVDEDEQKRLRSDWQTLVEQPMISAGRKPPTLIVTDSPYRALLRPLLDFVLELSAKHPERVIAVVIPELVETHWTEAILHNHRAAALKTWLYLRGTRRIAVINVPWYLDDPAPRSSKR
jgi:amino acid transporter